MMIRPPGKPLPLKQRTSSVDQRRDYNSQTWTSVLGILKAREYFLSVDHFSIWRRHLAWAVESGSDLRTYMTQRYASSMVFMSLLLATELNVLFNSAGVTTEMRQALQEERYGTISFWAGFTIIMGTILSLLSLVSIFTAWTMVSAVSAENAHCIFRSSIGQYVAQMPGRYIVCSLYSFLLWICLFILLLLPPGLWSSVLIFVLLGLFIHTISSFSAFGRIIMHTGAMGSTRIFEKNYETSLLPHMLHAHLLVKAKANLGNRTSIMRQYLSKRNKPITRMYSEDEMSGQLSDRSALSPAGHLATSEDQKSDDDDDEEEEEERPPRPSPPPPPPSHTRRRTNSLVRFDDGIDTNGERVSIVPPPSPKMMMMTTPRNQEIHIDAAAVAGKTTPSMMSAITLDNSSFPTPPAPSSIRRPPRPQLTRRLSESRDQDSHAHNTMMMMPASTAATASMNNASNNHREVHPLTGQHTEFAERWITSSMENLPPIDNANGNDSTIDFDRGRGVHVAQTRWDNKTGATTASFPVSGDNPYLFHGVADPASSFVPNQVSKTRSTSVSSLDRSSDGDDDGEDVDNQGHCDSRLLKSMTDDERFNQEYGDLFESEENFSGSEDVMSNNSIMMEEQQQQQQQQELPIGGVGSGANETVPRGVWDYASQAGERQSLLDGDRIERGVYDSFLQNGTSSKPSDQRPP